MVSVCRTPKQLGEWVELQFMATASVRGYHVLKPWGDSLEYDIPSSTAATYPLQAKSATAQRHRYFCRIRTRAVEKALLLSDSHRLRLGC